MRTSVIGALKKVYTGLQAFSSHNQGSMLIEFAFIVPILLIIFIGTVETTNYLGVNRRINSAAYTVADLAGRVEAMDTAGMVEIWKAAALIVSPDDLMKMNAVLTSVIAQGSDYDIDWSSATGTGAPRTGVITSGELGANLVDDGGNLLVVDISYPYVPVITQNMMSFTGITLTSHIVMKPRRTTQLIWCNTGVNIITGTCNP
jgi:Flp pilus assembly protein TadG